MFSDLKDVFPMVYKSQICQIFAFTCHQANHIGDQFMEAYVFVKLFPHCSSTALVEKKYLDYSTIYI